MATHSSILTWEIPWTEGTGGLQSMRVGQDWATNTLTLSKKLDIYSMSQCRWPALIVWCHTEKVYFLLMAAQSRLAGKGGRAGGGLCSMQSFRDSDSFPSLGSLLRFLTQVLYVPSADAQRNRMESSMWIYFLFGKWCHFLTHIPLSELMNRDIPNFKQSWKCIFIVCPKGEGAIGW